jgi:hypothetical protein
MAATPVITTTRSESSPHSVSPSTRSAPIVLDVGKQRRKRIKELRRGAGKLMDEINASIEELRTAGALSPEAQPVVVVVRQKRRKMRAGLPGFLQG